MKKIILISLIAIGLGMSSCVNEVEEVFDKPASQRLEERMNECKTLLTSAEHGWLIEYYPSSQQSYGGSSYTAKFTEDGNATVTGELAQKMAGDVSKTITSHYSINSSSSVVLTFDTYNDYIHYWSDPDEWSGNRFEGDFEFAYVSGNAERMIFRGIKTDNQIIFTALDTDIISAAKEIVETQADVVDKLYLGFQWDAGSESEIVLYDDDNYNLLTYYPDGDLTGAYVTIPYAYTSEGISFYQPATIEGITVKNFKWENGAFTSMDAVTASGTSASVTLTGLHGNRFIHYDQFIGTYSITYNGAAGEVTTTVKLSEKERYSTFNLTGLGNYSIEIGYSKADGKLSMVYQYLGRFNSTVGNLYVFLCPWDSEAGRYTWAPGSGYDIIHNGDVNNFILTFADNGVWANPVTGMLFYGYSTPTPGPNGGVGSVARFSNLQPMIKQ